MDIGTPIISASAPTDTATAGGMAQLDPLRPTAADGWSPDRVVAVQSRNIGGFGGSALQFALGGVDEQPGQRLSTAQVEALAPFYAKTFGVDEQYVRDQLAQVYLYVGGPSTTANQAMTIGHHVFIPDEKQLRHILEPTGRGWLAHELAHTMQFLTYENASPHRFLSDYIASLVMGHDPPSPGGGRGKLVWGSIFTGMRSAGHPENELGSGASSIRDRALSTVLPSAIVSVPVALAGGGALAAARITSGRHVLGGGGHTMRTSFGVIAGPAIAGSIAGAYADKFGTGWAGAIGAVAGGLIAGGTLLRGGAFSAGGAHASTELGRELSRGGALALAIGATVGGALIGLTSARASANTTTGWSNSAGVLRDLARRPDHDEQAKNLSYQDALHDANWLEIDAEAVSRQYLKQEGTRASDAPPVEGRVPTPPHGVRARIDADMADRLTWGVKMPLLLGVPAAAAVGATVLGSRTGMKLFDETVRQGHGPMAAVRASLQELGSARRGMGNSFGIGAAVTMAPLVAGGMVGPIVYNATGSTMAARIGGAGAGAVTAGALLTLLLKSRGSGLIATSGKVLAGMAAAAGVGLLAGGIATDALRPHESEYDITKGTTAK